MPAAEEGADFLGFQGKRQVVAHLPAYGTTQIAAGTLVYGAWDQVIVGQWGVLEIARDPFANFRAGVTGVRCMLMCDVTVRQAGAFTVATSVT